MTVQDPKGIDTRIIFDKLGRKRYLVENYDDFDESDESDIGGTNGDEDRVTEWEYNGLNMITDLTAHWVVNSSDETQTTQSLYKDDYNAALVTNIIYPDSADTDASGSDQVEMTYDLDGRVATRTDQRGVTITYEYDDTLRRLEKQRFSNTTVPTGVDTTIRSIFRTYDSMGKISKISSYAQADPIIGTDDPVNEIVYVYDDLGRVVTEYQEHEDVSRHGRAWVYARCRKVGSEGMTQRVNIDDSPPTIGFGNSRCLTIRVEHSNTRRLGQELRFMPLAITVGKIISNFISHITT